MGDPGGIGPEVIVKALADADMRAHARYILFGMGAPLHAAADKLGIKPFWWRVAKGSAFMPEARHHEVLLVDSGEPGSDEVFAARPTRRNGELSFSFVEQAIELAKQEDSPNQLSAQAIVTAPICKEAWALAGRKRYPGHTELLATRFGSKRYGMMFVCDQLRVILVTTHLPLMNIRDVLTIGKVYDAIDLGHQACQSLGIERPRIAVCGLNPHAGEGGLLGDEEDRLVTPAINLAAQHGIDARGPFPADTIFRDAIDAPGDAARSRKARFDLVVAMYHDQGLIPMKLLFRDQAVNMTVGLPCVRPSPDHGTAFDIAGQGKADAGSMRGALHLALRVARAKLAASFS